MVGALTSAPNTRCLMPDWRNSLPGIKKEFVGYDAVVKQRQFVTEWRFVRLVVESPEADPLAGDPILLNGECVGYVTSGGYGFRINKTLALGYVTASTELTDQRLEVQILGASCPAVLSNQAFYDPENRRLRA